MIRRPRTAQAIARFRLVLGLLAVCVLSIGFDRTAAATASQPSASPSDAVPALVVQTATLPDGSVIQGQVDRALVAARDRLQALMTPPSQDAVDAEAARVDPVNEKDFSVPLDRLAAIDARIPLLEIEIGKMETQRDVLGRKAVELRRQAGAVAPPNAGVPSPSESAPTAESAPASAPEIPAELAADIVGNAIRLDVARTRLAYLKTLSARLTSMPELARVALLSLGAPRSSLRARVDASRAAADALDSAGHRLTRVAERLEAGSLVGFVLEARELASDLRAQVESLSDAASEFSNRADALKNLADTLEGDGLRVHALYVLTAAEDAPVAVDRRFDELLAEQRRLRRRLSGATGFAGDLGELISNAKALVPDPSALGTASEARAATNQAVALRVMADKALTEDVLDLEQWQLAWVNDAVAVLSTRISPYERAQAYSLSTEMIADLRAEAIVAWNRANDAWTDWQARSPGWSALLTTDAGHDLLFRGLGMVLAIALGALARQRTARAAISVIRWLARGPSVRPYLGAIVRWTGLLQTVVQVAVLYPVYWAIHALLGAETVMAEILSAVFIPFFLYQLLRQILIGATRQITRGRPALIPMSADMRERLLSTYRRLGLVFAWCAMIDSLAMVAVGPGRIVSLVDGVTFVWIAVWAGWATLTWRRSLAQAWHDHIAARADSFEAAIARWMGKSRFGFVLSPLAAVRVILGFTTGVVAGRLSGTTLAARLRAMFLRRRSRKVGEDTEARSRKASIPEEYIREFPLYPLVDDRDAVLIPRDWLVDSICEQIVTWRESKTHGSAVLVGQKGIGKTTLAAMVTHKVKDLEILTHTLRGTLLTDLDLVRALAKPLGHPDAKSAEELAEALRSGPEQIVVIDEAHSAFLRVIGGYRAYDALVSLVNTTSERIFWLLIFNRHTWSFLDASRSRVHYFRRVIKLPEWTSAEIQDLIRRRTTRIGYKLVFGEMLRTDEIGSANELDLIDGSDAYFRLLWESSGGNPRIATCLWLDSLTPIGDKLLEVGLFSEATPKVLAELGDDLMFALAAVTQRENLSTLELAHTINLPLGFAQFAVRYLSESGLLEPKDDSGDRVTLAPRYYNQVLRVLRNRHLLLE